MPDRWGLGDEVGRDEVFRMLSCTTYMVYCDRNHKCSKTSWKYVAGGRLFTVTGKSLSRAPT